MDFTWRSSSAFSTEKCSARPPASCTICAAFVYYKRRTHDEEEEEEVKDLRMPITYLSFGEEEEEAVLEDGRAEGIGSEGGATESFCTHLGRKTR